LILVRITSERKTKIEVLVTLAILYGTSADYILGLTDRQSVFLDDLSEKDQKIVLSMLVALKEELQNNKTDGWPVHHSVNRLFSSFKSMPITYGYSSSKPINGGSSNHE